jgi:hypothetical protein
MGIGLPDPEKGHCPECEKEAKSEQLFVPLYLKNSEKEVVVWMCTRCRYMIQPGPIKSFQYK